MLELDLLECYDLTCVTVLRLVNGSVRSFTQLRLTLEADVTLLWWVANIIAHVLVLLGLFLAVGLGWLLLVWHGILLCLDVHLHNEIPFLLIVFLHWNVHVFVVHRLLLSY